ncbi:hypothetical protein BKA67DRAFT_549288 [Truncatella angustata]|uniref:Uncharacterized protein n=1 Tax=Truncatella angustata TaxID=152316 RepID=A0A9P8UWY4_9PEZI|nr:uncharacterized protein BKA67DRAFT_549288 [Truncatella angustata]KAH6660819.1 hypothetical protein BKA67DRAFT_549288 [Truncatella angustata]
MSELASILAIFFIPETIHRKRCVFAPKDKQIRETYSSLNTLELLSLFRNLNTLLISVASCSIVWNMYSFLVPMVYVINLRFGLMTPLQSGLFDLGPGSG